VLVRKGHSGEETEEGKEKKGEEKPLGVKRRGGQAP